MLYTRESLAISVRRRLTSREVQEVLSELYLGRGCSAQIRSDNGPEFIARALWACYGMLTIASFFIEPGSPWENGYVESVNGELFHTRKESQIITEKWRTHDNRVRPHSSLVGKPSAHEAIQLASWLLAWQVAQTLPAGRVGPVFVPTRRTIFSEPISTSHG